MIGARMSDPSSNRKSVLVVDDELMVRAFVAATLQSAGYQVLEAGGFESTQRLIERDAPKLQLLLTDVVMPKGSGPTVAAWLRERVPGPRVLYMSSYHSPEQLAHIRDPLLSKPCQADTLLEAVRSVLDGPHG